MNIRFAIYGCWFALAVVLAGCVTGPGARKPSGTYVHRETGGVIVFRPTGEFYYSFTTPTETLRRNLGHYHFDQPTDTVPLLSVRSAHAGLFRFRVSESGDKVFLTHADFASQQVY